MADFSNSIAAPNATSPSQGFMEALLEPLPAAVLVDTEYNSMLRLARRDAWWNAGARTRYHDARRHLHHAAFAFDTAQGNNPKCDHRKHDEILEAYRESVAAQMLVPAPDQLAVTWKRQALKQIKYLPISEADALAAIAEDERWLAAHPTRRSKALARGDEA